MANIEWEFITVSGKAGGGTGEVKYVMRSKVPGGWLIAVYSGCSGSNSVTFMPDPRHEWDGNSLP